MNRVYWFLAVITVAVILYSINADFLKLLPVSAGASSGNKSGEEISVFDLARFKREHFKSGVSISPSKLRELKNLLLAREPSFYEQIVMLADEYDYFDPTTQSIPVPNRLIIKGNKELDFSELVSPPKVIIPLDMKSHLYILQFENAPATVRCMDELQNLEGVKYVERDRYASAESSLGSKSGSNWGVKAIEADLYAEYLSDNNFSEKDEIVIAIIDSGIDISNKSLVERVTANVKSKLGDEDDDNSGHGSQVAEIIIDTTPKLDNIKILPMKSNKAIKNSPPQHLLSVVTGVFTKL